LINRFYFGTLRYIVGKGLNVTSANNKLRITLTKAPDIVNGPYGTFDLYIRSNNIFTVVEVYVE